MTSELLDLHLGKKLLDVSTMHEHFHDNFEATCAPVLVERIGVLQAPLGELHYPSFCTAIVATTHSLRRRDEAVPRMRQRDQAHMGMLPSFLVATTRRRGKAIRITTKKARATTPNT